MKLICKLQIAFLIMTAINTRFLLNAFKYKFIIINYSDHWWLLPDDIWTLDLCKLLR